MNSPLNHRYHESSRQNHLLHCTIQSHPSRSIAPEDMFLPSHIEASSIFRCHPLSILHLSAFAIGDFYKLLFRERRGVCPSHVFTPRVSLSRRFWL
ncbi:hypothetical protein CEXT_428261 [Caerostris extrusa]|uniref:Uncharacterized protein n=1 Tax=Caerostris extrusa TaxID=172846 RepID=A0AAV4X7C9_CAEEX|nr:hypothetical protein CEXT_428261 [Caerostris extrusa]